MQLVRIIVVNLLALALCSIYLYLTFGGAIFRFIFRLNFVVKLFPSFRFTRTQAIQTKKKECNWICANRRSAIQIGISLGALTLQRDSFVCVCFFFFLLACVLFIRKKKKNKKSIMGFIKLHNTAYFYM